MATTPHALASRTALLALLTGPALLGQQKGTVPVPLPEPSPRAKVVWDYSRTQVIERLVERLRGATSLRAWRFAKHVLSRSCDDEEVQQALIQYLEKHLMTRGEDAPARNAIEVMRRSKNAVFSPALMRATRHSLRTLSEDAMAALESCADASAVAKLLERFADRHLRSQVLVMRVLARRGAPDVVVPFLRKVIDGKVTLAGLTELTASLLETFDQGAPQEIIRGTLKGKLSLFPKTAGEMAAKLLHVAGEEEGRFALLRAMEAQKEPVRKAALLSALAERAPEKSLDAVLGQVAESASPIVRRELAKFLGKIPAGSKSESNVVALLEVLASDDVREVELQALESLRGRSKPTVDRLLSGLETARGSELRQHIEAMMRARDPRAVDVFARRLDKAVGRDKQLYVQALGRMGIPEALPHLEKVMRGPSISFGPEADSVAYAAIVTTNIYESEEMLWRLYRSLDPAEGGAARSHILKTLANLAKAPGEDMPKRLARIHDGLRAIVMDAKAPSRERLQALDYLRGGTLALRDAMRLGRKMRRDEAFADEELRGSFNDFLSEFF